MSRMQNNCVMHQSDASSDLDMYANRLAGIMLLQLWKFTLYFLSKSHVKIHSHFTNYNQFAST